MSLPDNWDALHPEFTHADDGQVCVRYLDYGGWFRRDEGLDDDARCTRTHGPGNAGEVRSVSATGGEKGTKLARFDLLPVGPLRQVAEHYGKGASKYADHNWRRGYEWSKSYAALQRHATQFWGGEDIDEETGSHHMAAVTFHALALLEFAERFPDFDDRFKAPEPEVDYLEEPLADWERELLYGPSTETPDPIGCIATVTGDLGDAGHNFDVGDEVRVVGELERDNTLKCQLIGDLPYRTQWLYEVDLA